MFEKLLIAHDGSDGAWKAFDAAIELAVRLQASLHMISVEEDLPRYAETMMEVDERKKPRTPTTGVVLQLVKGTGW